MIRIARFPMEATLTLCYHLRITWKHTDVQGGTIYSLANVTFFQGALIAPVNATAGGWQNDGTQSFLADYTDKVGIGTTTPWAKLSIKNNYGSTLTSLFSIGSSTAADNSTANTFLTVTNSGTVGIGTTSSAYALDVNGDLNVATGKCFRVNGVCIGYVTKLAAIYATSTPGTNATVVFSGGAAPSFSSGTLTLPASTTQIGGGVGCGRRR